MPRYPALTIRELQAIQEANKGNPAVRRLLWEIHRLHEVLISMDLHLRGLDPDLSYFVGVAKSHCVVLLDQEPAVRWCRFKDEEARRKSAALGNINAHYGFAAEAFVGPNQPIATPRRKRRNR
ncbi:hypothetical protein [Bordetella genomosp. 4]|uniref:Uncharacterized protein n=1 Tax=Bordetella genomosp. 4 TaxID=463044 RepID=A0A261U7S7_9BORD|nr:hypothetical protein [Bordetella genomosp. 4]OZI57685.1 hypothetical protein CAL20_09940 [Bordetella genomosp. 4]